MREDRAAWIVAVCFPLLYGKEETVWYFSKEMKIKDPVKSRRLDSHEVYVLGLFLLKRRITEADMIKMYISFMVTRLI